MPGAEAPEAGQANGRAVGLVELVAGAAVLPLAAATWLALLTAGAGRLMPGLAVTGGALVLVTAGWALLRASRRGVLIVALTPADVVAVSLAVVGLWRVLPAASPWPTLLDASWYVNTGARIAADGGLAFRPAALELAPEARPVLVSTFRDQGQLFAGFPDDAGRGFHAVAFAVPDVDQPVARPYHPPFFAAWIAVWARRGDPARAGAAVLPWALAYLLLAGALARAAFGPLAAPLAVVLVAGGPAFAYYGATPYAEVPAGALLLAGVWLAVRLAGAERPRPAVAALAGAALGLAVLAKVELGVPLAVCGLWWCWSRRTVGGRLEGLALAGGAALPLAHAAWLAATVSSVYFALNASGVLDLMRAAHLRLLIGAGGAVALGLVLAALRHRRPPRRRPGLPSGPALRRWAGVVAVVALAAATVGGRLAGGEAPSTVAILTWLVSPLGLWAAVAGLVRVLESDDRRPGLLVALSLTAVPLVLAAPLVTQTLSPLYTARRFVPLVVPLVAVLGAALATRLVAESPVDRRRVALVAGGLLLVLAGQWWAAAPLAAERDLSGGPAVAARIAAHTAPGAVLLFPSTLGGDTAGNMAGALWTLEGRETAVIGAPGADPERLLAAIAAWRAAGRSVYLVTDRRDPGPAPTGYELLLVGEESWITTAPAPIPDLPPERAPVDFAVHVFAISPTEDSG